MKKCALCSDPVRKPKTKYCRACRDAISRYMDNMWQHAIEMRKKELASQKLRNDLTVVQQPLTGSHSGEHWR